MLLPAVLVAVGVLAYFTIRTTFQLDKLRQQAVFESTFSLATDKADRLDKRVITEDNVVVGIETVLYFTITDPKSATYEIANPLQAIEQHRRIRHASDDDRSPGVVLEQKPAANQTLGKGMAVDLVVNSD